MDEADSATKALGLDEPPIGMPTVEGSDTESEAEVTTMSVMAETGNIDMGAEALPNPDEAEAAFAGKAVFSRQAEGSVLLVVWDAIKSRRLAAEKLQRKGKKYPRKYQLTQLQQASRHIHRYCVVSRILSKLYI